MNNNLNSAKRLKRDEFYTQYADVEREMRAYVDHDPDVFRDRVVLCPCDDPEWSAVTRFFADHFGELGLKRLISTSLFPGGSSQDAGRGRIAVVDSDPGSDPLPWGLLEGSGDFRSAEVVALRDEADIVVTNPPFSLFREFVVWLVDGGVLFSVVGNKNAVTYRELFPLVMGDRVRVGASGMKSMRFIIPDSGELSPVPACWFTNLEHGGGGEPLVLQTMGENLDGNARLRGKRHAYQRYENYDAVEVPATSAIPSDVDGLMGVPVSFMDKYCAEQFRIVDVLNTPVVGGERIYKRIIIEKR